MKSDPNKWYVYTRGWECPCYELYVEDDEVKDGFRTRKQARQWIENHKDDKDFIGYYLMAAKG